MGIKTIPLTEKQKQQLKAIGFSEDEINSQTLVDITLWKQALNGNVSALTQIRSILAEKDDEIKDDIVDISKEVKKEEKKILELLDGLSNAQKDVNAELIRQVAFQSVILRHLANDISKNGVKEKYKNGANQWGWKDRTEVKTYNNMIKSYQGCMRQLNELLNNFGIGVIEDEFDEFNKQY